MAPKKIETHTHAHRSSSIILAVYANRGLVNYNSNNSNSNNKYGSRNIIEITIFYNTFTYIYCHTGSKRYLYIVLVILFLSRCKKRWLSRFLSRCFISKCLQKRKKKKNSGVILIFNFTISRECGCYFLYKNVYKKQTSNIQSIG